LFLRTLFAGREDHVSKSLVFSDSLPEKWKISVAPRHSYSQETLERLFPGCSYDIISLKCLWGRLAAPRNLSAEWKKLRNPWKTQRDQRYLLKYFQKSSGFNKKQMRLDREESREWFWCEKLLMAKTRRKG
jgi:hypothetical protein